MNRIESLQNSHIKETALLKQKKGRDEKNCFLAEGFHTVEEALKAGLVEEIFALEPLENYQGVLTLCSQPVLNKLSSQKSDAKIIAVCTIPESVCSSPKKVLILDRIQDPGNFGTLVRSAYAFGIDQIIYSQGCADPFNPKTIQSSQGAVFFISLKQQDLKDALADLKDKQVPVLAAALHQDSVQLSELETSDRYAIMIGNEGQGISSELISMADQTVFIEMNAFESLNAAVAGSIMMYVLFSRKN